MNKEDNLVISLRVITNNSKGVMILEEIENPINDFLCYLSS